MARSQAINARRFTRGLSHSKSRYPIPGVFAFVAVIVLIGYIFWGSGVSGGIGGGFSKVEGDYTCTFEVQRAIPILKKTYGDSMHRVLHVGPDTCSVVSKLLREEETEAWGVEPYDIEDADRNCKRLVRRGNVRVADIKFPLPYRAKTFSLVIISDALDYLSPKYLNKTLPELARVSSDGIIIFTGYPDHAKAKAIDPPKYGRPAKKRSPSWWIRFFVQTSLEENEVAIKKFEQASTRDSYKPGCQIFHLNSYH
ncbi:putative pectin methylesterase CGR2 [Heracleum sosnowskyi]|uniref:Pectin methylesterase CGR2 n=1 Tax=Heracleum sosnowskyi TaxID=360622 RepID=A0AAD8M684_9APIA|nr:putative pectin methylesterase CGR2 [Heracleum sosnowskyi]